MRGLWPIGAPALGGFGAALLLTHWLPFWLALACACACAFLLGRRGAGWRERYRAAGDAWKYRKGQLPVEKVYAPLPSDLLAFKLGRFIGGDDLEWRPGYDGEKHLIILGATGSGKTVAAKLLAASAHEQGCKFSVMDAVGGADFEWAVEAGLVPKVISDHQEIAEELARIEAEVMRRAAFMRDFRQPVPAPDGSTRMVGIASVIDYPQEMREEHNLEPMLVFIDEAPRLLAMEDSKKQEISGPIGRISATGRKAGVFMVTMYQRADRSFAKQLGFVLNNFQAVLLLGRTGLTEEQMAMGSGSSEIVEVMAAEYGLDVDPVERASRTPGRGMAKGLDGIHPPLICQTYWFDPILYWHRQDDEAQATTASSPSPFSAPAPPASGDASGEAALSDQVADPEAGPPVGDAGWALRALRALAPVLPSAAKPEAQAAEGGPLAAFRRALAPARQPRRGRGAGGSAPAASAASRWLARAVWRVRVKAWAWRWRAAPRVRAGARDRSIPRLALEEYGHVCAVCGETRPPLDVDHKTPIQFGGPDVLANVWVLCGVCHSYKTDAENWAKGERAARRRFSLPDFGWSPWVVIGLGVLGWGAFSRWTGTWPHPLIPAVVLVGLVVWNFRSKYGLDKIPTYDRLAEHRVFRSGTPAGARLRATTAFTIVSANVQTTAMGGAFLWLVGWFLAGRIG